MGCLLLYPNMEIIAEILRVPGALHYLRQEFKMLQC